VTCCDSCNKKKGDKSPEESKMTLLRKPFKPSYYTFLKSYLEKSFSDWDSYLID